MRRDKRDYKKGQCHGEMAAVTPEDEEEHAVYGDDEKDDESDDNQQSDDEALFKASHGCEMCAAEPQSYGYVWDMVTVLLMVALLGREWSHSDVFVAASQFISQLSQLLWPHVAVGA